MISVAFITIIAIVALVCLALGMAISNNQNSRGPEQLPNNHSSHSGWGWVAATLLAVPCVLVVAAVGWMALAFSPEVEQATVVEEGPRVPEVAYHRAELPARSVSGEAQASDRTPRLPLEEAPVASIEPEAVAPAAAASSDGESEESPNPTDRIESAAPYESGEDSFTTEAASAETWSAPAPFQFKADLAIWAIVGAGLFCLAILIGAGIWIAHRRQHWSLSGMARSMVRSLWVVPMLASIAWVGYLMWPHLSIKPLQRDTSYIAAQHEFDRYIDETQFQFNLPATTSDMPAWVTEGITSANGLVHVPVHGGWRVSKEEARNEAQAQALRTINQDFRLAFPSAHDWRMDVPLKDLHAVAEEAVETKSFQFGDAEEPMYRTHLLVELSDNVRSELFNRWKPDLQEYRIGMLLTFGGLLTLICFAGAACLNLDLRTEGHYRRWLRTATVLVVVAAAAVAHGVLNSLWFQHSV